MTAVLALVGTACAGGDLPSVSPVCDDVESLALVAQAVPESQVVPCWDGMPFAWEATTFDVDRGKARIHFEHEVAGLDAARMLFRADCEHPDSGEAVTPPVDGEPHEQQTELEGGGLQAVRTVPVDGGCFTLAFDLPIEDAQRALTDFDATLTWLTRSEVSERLREQSDGRLELNDFEPVEEA